MLKRKHLFKPSRDNWEYGGTMAEPATEPVPTPRPRPRPAARMTVIAAFTVIFFAGASFTAVAGDQAATLLEGGESAAEAPLATGEPLPADEALAAEAALPDEETSAETASENAQAAETAAEETAPDVEPVPTPAAEATVDPSLAHELEAEAPAPEAAQAPPVAEAPAPAPAATPVAAAAPRATAKQAPRSERRAAARKHAAAPKRTPAPARPKAPPAREPEIDHGETLGEPTVWLNRELPDPTPRAKRLAPKFANALRAAARRHGADWAAVLGVLRAQGSRGATPATAARLDTLSRRLAHRDTWRAALAISGREKFADRTEALRDYYKAVGLRSLVKGLKVSKERLVKRLLKDERVWVYWGGQSDLEAHRIDVRVVVLVLYLAERHESVTVSSLFSGHRKYSRPGVISAHTYGQAVDIAAVGGTSVLGNSQPGGMTEEAVRSVLLLPAELQPQQVISLLGLGGPSFPLADHGDHIHVGY